MKKAIGLDIGGTKILAGVVDEEGHILQKVQISTDSSKGRDKIISNLHNALDTLMQKDISGIGIGSAGRIDFKTGIVDYATDNLPGWMGLNLKKLVEEKYSLPVIVENDVNAAAAGEMWLGAAKGVKNFIMLTVGTGLGGAIVINNQIIRGKHFSAGEFGHIILYPKGRECNCGKKGCAEQYISGTAIYKRFNELSKIKKVDNAKEVFSLLDRKNRVAQQVIEEFINSFKLLMINLRNSIDSDKYLIGGGIIGAERYWWNKFIDSIPSDMVVKQAKLGQKATMLGAASMVFG